jgi:signal transduction histidine kinase
LLDPRGRGIQTPFTSAPVALAFTESYLWAALTPLIFLLVSRTGFARSNWIPRALGLLGIGILLAMTVEALLAYLRFEFVFSPRRRPSAFNPLLGVKRLFWLDDLIIYIAVLAAGFARDYFLRYRAREQVTARLQAQLAEARLANLRTQLNPHFLFNTLHAISTLVERDPRGVRRMIARLSELLRTSLDGGTEQETPLRNELAFLDRYLEIMQIRFQGRLAVRTTIDPDVMEALVPTLVLQPIVENALKHGVDRESGAGRIEIRARRDGERVVLSVRDEGPGLSKAIEEGVGLRNTRDRLAQLYGEEQHLSVSAASSGQGVLAELSLPFHTRADLRAASVGAAT